MKSKYHWNGKPISEKEFRKRKIAGLVEGIPQTRRPGAKWPVESVQLACHPKQVSDLNKHYKSHGCNAYHDSKGRCHIASAKEMTQVAELRGILK